MPTPFAKPEDFFLGVLVGIYGNWLISFLDKLVFPAEIETVFYVQFLLALSSFITFILYLMSAYTKKYYPSLFWAAHSVLPLVTFIFQNSFIKNDPNSLSRNIVFWTVGFPILCLILLVEFLSWGRYREHILKNRWKKPLKLGILNDMEWDVKNREIYAGSDVPPTDWKKAFEAFPKVNIELIDVTKSFDRYVAILNPYGGVYPEIDLKKLATLNKILDFVREGGVFINVADVPSYYAYNRNLGRKIDNTSPIYVIENNQLKSLRPFELTPLIKELGLRVFNMDESPQFQDLGQFTELKVKVVSKRVAVVESNLEPCIPAKSISTNLGSIETSALFTVKYAEGDFLFSLIWINDKSHIQEAKNAIKNAIVKITTEKLTEKVSALKK